MPSDNEYMRKYMKQRWERRRAEAIEFLGGKCVVCGAIRGLEFDRVDPATKIVTVGSASSRSNEFFWAEVEKCQLLCNEHHKEKTREEIGVPHGGGVSGKRNCKCSPCKARKAAYMRSYSAPVAQLGRATSF